MKRFWLHGLVLIFFPGLTYVGIGLSMSLGLIACSLIGVLIEFKILFKNTIKPIHFLYFLIIFLILFLWGLYVYLEYNELKPLVSSLIVLLFLYAYIISIALIKADLDTINKFLASLRMLTYLLIFLGWIKLTLGSDFGPYAAHPKALFPYAEDSHYALTFAMFSMGYIAGIKNNNIEILFILINILILGILLPSLTMMTVFILGLTIYFIKKSRGIRYIYFFSVLFLSTTIFGVLSTIDYFAQRIDVTAFDNLTLLVWLQGWFIVIASLQFSNWFGMGFQMLGFNKESLPEISYYIYDFFSTGFYNIEDGGFLAAKIISELGLFGILLIFLYLKFFLTAYKLLTSINHMDELSKKNKILLKICSGFIFAFVIEMFLRGLGYFSVGVLITIMAIIIFNNESSKKFN